MILVPLLFFLALEFVLRVAGYGYPTAFLLPAEQGGRKVFIQNDRFGWRFFSPNFARQPAAFAIPRAKPQDTVRVFVFGESAAFGDPQPEFGLPRMLEALLELRYPGARFEVVNAAMTGINSHTVLPIARDCGRAGGDIWVVYMGNNEVVGPFGAGTVFGPQTPRLALIRASLALKRTRAGQLLDQLVQQLDPPPADKSDWGGMLMSLGNQVRAEDPRMAAVYHHFEQNLAGIVEAGRRSGAGVVVSTVAVNLRDCAPFGSAFRPGLGGAGQTNWQDCFRPGLEAQAAGRHREALERFRQAAQIDDTVAALQYASGLSALALGQTNEAQASLLRARDLDTLRFRCDRRLNEITRRLASYREEERVQLADAESIFARQGFGLPGGEFFYEHVHLTFEGNYLLARIIAEQVAKLLPESVATRAGTVQPWPAPAACAARLGWNDWQRLAAVSDMLGRLGDAPFTYQLDHADQVARLGRQAEQLQAGAQAAVRNAAAISRDALARAPDDPMLQLQCGHLLAAAGEAAGAVAALQRLIELLPNRAQHWLEYGKALERQQQHAEAARAFQEAFRLDPLNFWALYGLAQVHLKQGRRDDARREFERTIALKPRFGLAYLGLGQLLEEDGRKDEAEKNYRLALANRIYRAAELTALAQFCQGRGWNNEALTNYLDAVKLSPADPVLRLNTGRCLVALGRNGEALAHFAQAVRLAPDFGQARFLFGMELGGQGRAQEATEQFREAVRLMPDVVEARVNLGIALKQQGRSAEAVEQFREVLRRSPTNAVALKNVEELQ
jgi:tetratricopeptide (TPR) repeat protein